MLNCLNNFFERKHLSSVKYYGYLEPPLRLYLAYVYSFI